MLEREYEWFEPHADAPELPISLLFWVEPEKEGTLLDLSSGLT